jgi:hypothetical protein
MLAKIGLVTLLFPFQKDVFFVLAEQNQLFANKLLFEPHQACCTVLAIGSRHPGESTHPVVNRGGGKKHEFCASEKGQFKPKRHIFVAFYYY